MVAGVEDQAAEAENQAAKAEDHAAEEQGAGMTGPRVLGVAAPILDKSWPLGAPGGSYRPLEVLEVLEALEAL